MRLVRAEDRRAAAPVAARLAGVKRPVRDLEQARIDLVEIDVG